MPVNSKNYAFRFEIGLDIDDLKMLESIKQNLQIGNVTSRGKTAYFVVSSQKEVQVIIDIFSSYPLNTTKQFNFLDFKKAFGYYTNTKDKSLSLISSLEEIRSNMNTLRVDSALPVLNSFRITPY